MEKRIVISLTTIPSRLPYIRRILDNIRRQTRQPDIVQLNIPFWSKKEKTEYRIDPSLPSDYPWLKIHRCRDLGPITKLIPTLELEINPDTLIITLDDDMEYRPDLISDLIRYSEIDPHAAWAGDGWIVGSLVSPWTFYGYIYRPLARTPVSIIQGCSGCLYRRSFFGTIEDVDRFRQQAPADLQSAININDDIFISAYLASRGYRRWVYPGYLKVTTEVSQISAISGSAVRMFLKFFPLIRYYRQLGLFEESQVAPFKRRVGFYLTLIIIGIFILGILIIRIRSFTFVGANPITHPIVSPI